MKSSTSIIVFLLLIGIMASARSEKKIVCYYGSWATYRNGNGKLLVAMGGWNEGSENYSRIMKSYSLRSTLVKSIINFIQTWGFDGFDLDWEYPSQRGGSSDDYRNYISLLKELRESSPRGFIMSAAVGAATYLISSAYDVKNMNKYLDFINLMTYDYHGSWDTVTGHNAPFSSLDNTVSTWIRNGASPSKLVLGVPIYGRTWTLSNSNSHGVGASTSGIGKAGRYTLEKGMMTYLEICEEFHSFRDWAKYWDNREKVPYAFRGNQWLSYDNVQSVQLKAQYVNENSLGGIMVWSIDGDDVYGMDDENK
ncbi:acidic mammalian chitinase-like [Condylostylus longicornis]|uniref:acidic mammalian chitinase-like n=1 Tax=Condylostylus longicornis TaxID=2530218 RepID=UPI00244DBBEB|nr:acidic mammalian chitinase-like [Condylostylus longicornis]